MSEADGPPTFTCPCCGATSSHPQDIAHGYCSRCHAFTGDPELGPPHLAEACPERKTAGDALAEILMDRRMGTFEAAHLTGMRPEELEGVIHGVLAIDDRVAGHLAKLGPPAEFWLNFEAKDSSDGKGDGSAAGHAL
jgi:plasmid maintenance system antidote protein VapI